MGNFVVSLFTRMPLCCLTQSTKDMLPHVLLATLVVSCASQTLDDRFCNETIKTPFKTSCRSCSMNKYIACPDGSTKLTSGQGEADCIITVQLMKKYVLKLTGCRHTCERTAVIASCCQGYWGPDCRGMFTCDHLMDCNCTFLRQSYFNSKYS